MVKADRPIKCRPSQYVFDMSLFNNGLIRARNFQIVTCTGCVRLLSVLACRVVNGCKCRDTSFDSPEFILDEKN